MYLALGEDLPPALGCIPKQPDSKAEQNPYGFPKETSNGVYIYLHRPMHGAVTLSGTPFQGISVCGPSAYRCPAWQGYNSGRRDD